MNKTKETEFSETLERFQKDAYFTRLILVVFITVTLFSRVVLQIQIPWFIFVSLLVWLSAYLFLWPKVLDRQESVKSLNNAYFIINCLDFFFLTIAVHYLGGVEWLGVVFYVVTIVMAGLLLPKRRAVHLAVIVLLYYITLVALEYFQIIPHYSLFPQVEHPWLSRKYVLLNLIATASIFYFLIGFVGDFSEELKEKTREAEEAEKVLEVKVKARTRELEELADRQEEIIEERTKELRERVEQLEKFRKLTVGRELKMKELKEKIKEIKEE